MKRIEIKEQRGLARIRVKEIKISKVKGQNRRVKEGTEEEYRGAREAKSDKITGAKKGNVKVMRGSSTEPVKRENGRRKRQRK